MKFGLNMANQIDRSISGGMQFAHILLSLTFEKYKASIDVASKHFAYPNDPF